MKKKLIILIVFMLVLITSCADDTPKAKKILQEFDSAESCEFNINFGVGSGEIELFKYAYKENEFTCLEVSQDNVVYYVNDLNENIQYYDGFTWDGKVKLLENETKKIKFLDYMTELLYSEYDTRLFINAKFNFDGFIKSLDINIDDYVIIDQELYTTASCKVIIDNEKIDSITINVGTESFIISSIKSNENISLKADLNKTYGEIATYEEYQEKVDKDLLNAFNGVKPSEKPKALIILESFENAKKLEFNINIGWENSTTKIAKYAYKENEFIYLEMLEIMKYTSIYDLKNNYEYYNGTNWNGKVKYKYENQLEFNISDYLSNKLIIEDAGYMLIDGTFNALKLLEDLGFDTSIFSSSDKELYKNAFCRITTKNDNVTSIVIKIQDDMLIIDGIKYNNNSIFTPNITNIYEEIETYEEFQTKKSEDLSSNLDTDVLMKNVIND